MGSVLSVTSTSDGVNRPPLYVPPQKSSLMTPTLIVLALAVVVVKRLPSVAHLPVNPQLLSKIMGYILVAFSGIVKLPQVIKIVRSKSVEGLSASSFYLEVINLSLCLFYNIVHKTPFSTYGENFFILVQSLVLVGLLWKYSDNAGSSTIKTYLSAGFIVGSLTMLFGKLPPPVWKILGLIPIPLGVASRIPQIYANFKQGHTGQLALTTWLLNLSGAVVRIFTTFQEVNDPIVMGVNVVSTVTNAIVVGQILYCSESTKKLTDHRSSLSEETARELQQS